MSSFQERFRDARQWELDLRDKLRERGWIADLFGQALLTEQWRRILGAYSDSFGRPAIMRWMPDLITSAPDDPRTVKLIDAKTGDASTGNYSIEVDAHKAALAFENVMYVPVLFVWKDGVLTTHDVEHKHFKRLDGSNTNGSGTPFFLVKKQFAKKPDNVFPPKESVA